MNNPRLPRHPLVVAVAPIVEALGATMVPADEREAGDLPVKWEGQVLAAVRPAPLHGALDRLIESIRPRMPCTTSTMASSILVLSLRMGLPS